MGIISLSAAIEKGKFKTTVSKSKPDGKSKIIDKQDYDGASLESMIHAIKSAAKLTLEEQKKANEETGRKFASPVVMGWFPGDPFKGIDKLIRVHGIPEIQKKYYSKERDGGLLCSAVENVRRELKLEDGIYKPYYRAVTPIPTETGTNTHDPIQDRFVEILINKVRNYEPDGEAALSTLRNIAYQAGQTLGSQQGHLLKGSVRRADKTEDDYTKFMLVHTGAMGPAMKFMFGFKDLRKHFAKGLREAAGINEKHRMCIKFIGLDKASRPLQNVGEVTAFEELINSGAMKASALKDPYV